MIRTGFLILAIFFTLAAAHAFPIPFARFISSSPGSAKFLSLGALVGQKIPVKFKFLANPGVKGQPATGFGMQDAQLTFTALRLGNAESLLGMGSQDLRLYSFSIVRDTPLGGKTNLL